MNTVKYFQDLTKELKAVQNKIRNLIGRIHGPSDGAWKESVLRSVVRKYLPPSFTVGSGFIVTPEGVSTQIDVLVCDDSAPILFRDGDFLITTADCVRAVVEVKTSLNHEQLKNSLEKLSDISKLMKKRSIWPQPFIGLYCYNPVAIESDYVLNQLKLCSMGIVSYVIRALCFGDSQFYRFWEFDPRAEITMPYDSWHAYNLKKIAPGYFLHNLIESIFPRAVERAEEMWYPASGKEGDLLGTIGRLNNTPPVIDSNQQSPQIPT